MATNGGKRSSAPGNNSSLILGILVGMVLGLVIAGGVAWHLSKRPAIPANGKETADAAAASAPVPARPAPTAAAPTPPRHAPAASAVGEGKPRFQFYEILTDKEGAPKKSGHAPAPPREHTPPAAAASSYFLQAGSFTNTGDAESMKARLALLGMQASIQSADIPGKGTYYRVRLGPYRSNDELNKANATLKQNGINDAAPVRAQ
jgi:cell division protein FtsN